MTYKELYDRALWDLEHNNITLGEFDRITEPLNKEIPKEEQTDGDLISRKAVINAMIELCDTGETLKENPWRDNPHIDALIETVEEIPSAEKTASEKLDEDTTNNTLIHKALYHYCPMCGAKMKGEN